MLVWCFSPFCLRRDILQFGDLFLPSSCSTVGVLLVGLTSCSFERVRPSVFLRTSASLGTLWLFNGTAFLPHVGLFVLQILFTIGVVVLLKIYLPRPISGLGHLTDSQPPFNVFVIYSLNTFSFSSWYLLVPPRCGPPTNVSLPATFVTPVYSRQLRVFNPLF